MALVLCAVVFPAVPAWACDNTEILGGGCVDGSVISSSVSLTGEETTPGTKTDGSTPTTRSTSKPVDPGTEKKPLPKDTDPTVTPPDPGVQCDFGVCPEVTDTDPGTDPVEVDPVTLADIAEFVPVTGTTGVQPNGWAPVGLDANFYSTTVTHVVEGELLGRAAEVRFTPTAWHWDYGDGTLKTTAVGGATWAALGVDEFAPTATSHRYTAAGTYDIALTIDYGAEYRFTGDPWTPIDGTLTIEGGPLELRAGTASTVLVGADCGGNPSAPGC